MLVIVQVTGTGRGSYRAGTGTSYCLLKVAILKMILFILVLEAASNVATITSASVLSTQMSLSSRLDGSGNLTPTLSVFGTGPNL